MPKYASKYVGAGAAPSGWTKVGNVAIDTTGIATPNNSPFSPGISETYDTNGYVIVSDTTTANLVGRTTGGNTGFTASANTPTYWATLAKTDDSFITLVSKIAKQTFTSAVDAKSWLDSNGYWTSWITTSQIVTNGLILNLDAGNAASYPGIGTTWTDLSGNGNNGTLVNGVGYSSNNGGYLTFDGVNDYISINSSSSLNQIRTIEFWIYANVLVTSFVLSRSTYNYEVYAISDILYSYWGSSYNTTTNNPTYSTGTWYHFCFTVTGNSETIYKNGTLIGSRTLNTTPSYSNSGDLTIGIRNNFTYPFNGRISSLNLYDRVLNSTEITQNFDTLKSRYGL